MGTLVLVCGLAMFAAIAWAVRFHFDGRRKPIGFVIVALLSIVNIVIFVRELWRLPKGETQLMIALALLAAAAALFAWSLLASRSAALKLLFDRSAPHALVESGPFRFIRHPFYASYVLYWLGCAVATLHPVNLSCFALIVLALVVGARAEERRFEASSLAEQYAAYKRRTGLFWPRLWRGGT